MVTTVRLTPRVPARSRLDGSRSPACSTPPVTAASSCADIWTASGAGPARSTTTGRPDGKVVIRNFSMIGYLCQSTCRLGYGIMSTETTPLSSTPRTTLRRHRERGQADRTALYEVLDAGLICHLGVVADGDPVVLPTAYGRDGRHAVPARVLGQRGVLGGGRAAGLRDRHAHGRAGRRPVGVQPLGQLPQRGHLRHRDDGQGRGRALAGAAAHHRPPHPRPVGGRAAAHRPRRWRPPRCCRCP